MKHADSDVQSDFMSLSNEIACQAYRSALDRAAATTPSSLGVLYLVVKPVLFWEFILQKLNTTCPGITIGEYQTITQAKVTAAIALYDQLEPNLTDTSSTTYSEAKTEVAESARAKSEVLALAPADNVRQIVTTEITGRAQGQLIDSMLQAPWDKCRNTNDYDELVYLMQTVSDSDRAHSSYMGRYKPFGVPPVWLAAKS